jgi:Tol biopolymer transport system component
VRAQNCTLISECFGSFLRRRMCILPAALATFILVGGLMHGSAAVAHAQFVSGSSNTEPAWSPDGRQIAFVSDREWPFRIYVMDPDGRNVRRVTSGMAHDHHPAWSPDGQRIAFDRMPEPPAASDRKDIWVANADGTSEMVLTSALPEATYEEPAWSPDGRWIALSQLSGNDVTLLLVSLDGHESRPLLSGPAPGPEHPTWSPDGKRLAFSSYHGRSSADIGVVDVGTGAVSWLARDPGGYFAPAWSPDGRQIAFIHTPLTPDDRTHDFERSRLWLMDADGGNQRQLGDVVTDLVAPSWSPSGDAVVVGNKTGDLFIVRTDGTLARRLSWNGWADFDPAWSPDGQSIAYAAMRDGKAALLVISADGSHVKPVVTSFEQLDHPSWAPGSDQLVFAGYTTDQGDRLYVVKADGSGLKPITDRAGAYSRYATSAWSRDGQQIAFTVIIEVFAGIFTVPPSDGKPRSLSPKFGKKLVRDLDPAWSPDGRLLAFESFRDSDPEIYTMNRDGTDVKRLTKSRGYDGAPAWSPDGTHIAFTSGRDGAGRIYVMNADGSGVQRISDGPGNDFTAAWAPNGQRLVFVSTREGRPALFLMNADGSGVTRLTPLPWQDADSTRGK